MTPAPVAGYLGADCFVAGKARAAHIERSTFAYLHVHAWPIYPIYLVGKNGSPVPPSLSPSSFSMTAAFVVDVSET